MDRELLLLGILRAREMHGYELSEFLNAHMSLFFQIKKATAYKLLRKMEDTGWIKSREEQEGRRPTRRVYRVTPAGESQFQAVLRSSLGRFAPASFPSNVALHFLDAIPADEAHDLLRRRLHRIEEMLTAVEGHPEEGRHPLLAHWNGYLEFERDWLSEVMDGVG